METRICCIDAREPFFSKNDFLTLNLQGRPVFSYAVEAALQSALFAQIYLITDSARVSHLAQELYGDRINILAHFPPARSGSVCIINGHAVMVTAALLQKACSLAQSHIFTAVMRREICFADPRRHIAFLAEDALRPVNVFALYPSWPPASGPSSALEISSDSALVVQSKQEFELALVLKRKQQSLELLTQAILARIEEKHSQFSASPTEPVICLVGHSQLDDWNIRQLGPYTVLNCGIRGISSFEYDNYILHNGLLRCRADVFLVMHGTNDIVYGYPTDQIVESIGKTLAYIREKYPAARILFVPCLHVNGRADRSNRQIDLLNQHLRQTFESSTEWIDVSLFDDPFGDLDLRYTKDGLHLNDAGYALLRTLVENIL